MSAASRAERQARQARRAAAGLDPGGGGGEDAEDDSVPRSLVQLEQAREGLRAGLARREADRAMLMQVRPTSDHGLDVSQPVLTIHTATRPRHADAGAPDPGPWPPCLLHIVHTSHPVMRNCCRL